MWDWLFPRKPPQFKRLLKEVNRHFGRYRRDVNDCSDYARKCAELAGQYGVQVTVRVFDSSLGRHAAVEYRDADGERWIGDVVYGRPIRKSDYQQRMRTRGL